MRINKLTPSQTPNYEGDTRATPYITITLKWEEAQRLVEEYDREDFDLTLDFVNELGEILNG